MIRITADIAIFGSGFSGSLMALIFHHLGLKPVLIDKATHPRFTIGESSTPIADMILRSLADTYSLPRVRPLSAYGTWQDTYPELVTGRKRGFSYFDHHVGQPFVPEATHSNELLVAASNSTYYCDTHWMRADVDAFLVEEVRQAGLPFLDATTITALNNEDGWYLAGHRKQETVEIQATFVIDATGPAGVVPKALGIGDAATPFRTYSRALCGHFSGVKPWHELLVEREGHVGDHPYPCDDAALHHILDGAWMWMLRFNNEVVSAGFVLDDRRHPFDPSVSPDDEWSGWIERYPALQEQFATATLIAPQGGLQRTGRLQRRLAHAVGPTWAALPHTAGFVDPLHSTGIAHSLSGVERLAALFKKHWGSPSFAEALHCYETQLFDELALLDNLVAACYSSFDAFRLFTASTMLYFAAVIRYERLRAGSTPNAASSFLCADDPQLHRIVDEAMGRLSNLDPASAREVRAYESYVEDAITPYNTAGLFHPRVPNMYHHTASPLQPS